MPIIVFFLKAAIPHPLRQIKDIFKLSTIPQRMNIFYLLQAHVDLLAAKKTRLSLSLTVRAHDVWILGVCRLFRVYLVRSTPGRCLLFFHKYLFYFDWKNI